MYIFVTFVGQDHTFFICKNKPDNNFGIFNI